MKKEVLIFCLCGVLTMSGCGQVTAVPQRARPPVAATTPATAPVTAMSAPVRTISVPEETNPPQAAPTPTAEIVPPKQTANVSPVDMQTEQPTPAQPPDDTPAPQAPAQSEPKMGDKRTADGERQVWMTGFGWIPDHTDEGNHVEYAANMYESGNKIGYMGGDEGMEHEPLNQ